MMMCIRRSSCFSITREFRIRIEISIHNISMNISSKITVTMSTTVHRSMSIQLNFNNAIIVCIKAEAVTGTRMHPKPKKTKNQSFTENAGTDLVFWIFGFLFFCFFGFRDFGLHSKAKKAKNQKNNKKPKLFSVKLCFFCCFGFGPDVVLDRRNQG